MLLPEIYNIIELCVQKGICKAVISPGSRSAPLVLALARHPDIQSYVIPDERSAAFVAMGLAQQSQSPVILLCTSGSAALNFAPAVAEAFYQQIPLLVLTADRPPEWIDQQEGQSIHQNQVYGPHCKASFQLPCDYQHPDSRWHLNRLANEALELLGQVPTQPVHLNIPFREPFYPEADEEVVFDKNVRNIRRFALQRAIGQKEWDALADMWNEAERILIVGGQQHFYPEHHNLCSALALLNDGYQVPVLGDVIANFANQEFYEANEDFSFIAHHDLILAQKQEALLEELRPDLLISFGLSVLSKGLKQYLRRYRPRYHWHLQVEEGLVDTFQTLSHSIPLQAEDFFASLVSRLHFRKKQTAYKALWKSQNQKAKQYIEAFFAQPQARFSEMEACYHCLQALPPRSLLHIANSMPIRYVNYIGLQAQKNIQIFANRGTSGIDGSNSTALGAALAHEGIVTLLSGDMAFLYDRNAFWHEYLPPNLRIIVLNNQGGGIFRMIEGPRQQPEREVFFETKQRFQAKTTAQEAGFLYYSASSLPELLALLPDFFALGAEAKLLEIHSDMADNEAFFRLFKQDWLRKQD